MEHDYLNKNETCLGILSSRLELAPSQGQPSGSQLCLHSKIKTFSFEAREVKSHRVPKLSHVDLIQVEAEGKKFLSNKTLYHKVSQKNGFRIHWKSNLIVIIKTVRFRVKSTDQLFAGYQISGKERGHGWSDDFKR